MKITRGDVLRMNHEKNIYGSEKYEKKNNLRN